MKIIISTLIVVLVFTTIHEVAGQSFLKPFSSVSKKKTAYVTLETGEEVEGNIQKLKLAKKGLIKELHMTVNDEKVVYVMDDISTAYFPQSGLDKLTKGMAFMYDATQWDDEDPLYEMDRLQDGYAYYEKIDMELKGEDRKLLMQLLNPFPNNRIKVYHDPAAGEKGGMRVGGIKVQESQASNYYISKDGKKAARLRKQDYTKQFDELLGDCRSIKKNYNKMKWKNFEDAVMEYNANCPVD